MCISKIKKICVLHDGTLFRRFVKPVVIKYSLTTFTLCPSSQTQSKVRDIRKNLLDKFRFRTILSVLFKTSTSRLKAKRAQRSLGPK